MAVYDLAIHKENNIVDEVFDYVIQQIEMLFDTNKGDVIGDFSFGTNYEEFIWDINLPNSAITSQITSDINAYIDLAGTTFDVKTDVLHGTENDIILVTINIYFDSYYRQLTYNIG